jgi:hypothetical protein
LRVGLSHRVVTAVQASYARAKDIAETDKVFASALAEYRLPRLVGKRTVPSVSRFRSASGIVRTSAEVFSRPRFAAC